MRPKPWKPAPPSPEMVAYRIEQRRRELLSMFMNTLARSTPPNVNETPEQYAEYIWKCADALVKEAMK